MERENVEDLGDQLTRLLTSVDRPGDFYASGARTCPMPGIEIDDVGALAFPLLPYQAQQLVSISEAAPYGRGPDTLVDPTVRRAGQINPDRIRFTDAVWAHSLSEVVRDVARQLGVSADVRAEFYKLLVYESGDFFAPHRDTEKVDGMFATLVVCLPSRHRGGELIVRHGEREVTIDVGRTEVTGINYAAFYADCVHEIRPITDGYRVCLVYNLISQGANLSAPEHKGPIAEISRALSAWAATDELPTKLIHILEHHYTPAGLSFRGLKNGDAAAAQVLIRAAANTECDIHLAMISIRESGSAEWLPPDWSHRDESDHSSDEDFEVIEVIDHEQVIEHWLLPDDQKADWGSMPFNEDEMFPRDALDELVPDEQYFREATGNEGGSFERTYRRAAIVLWPKNRRLMIAAQTGAEFAVPMLKQLPEEDARTLAGHLLASWCGHDGRTRAELLEALTSLSAPELVVRMFERVITPDYDGAENAAIAGCWRQFERTILTPHIGLLLTRHFDRFAEACTELLARLLEDGANDVSSRQIVDAAIASMPVDSAEPSWQMAKIDRAIGTMLLTTIARLGDATLVERAAAHMLEHPKRYPMERVLIPVAIDLKTRFDAPALEGARCLHDAVLAYLRARIALPLEPPKDLAREGAPRCKCADCTSFAAFLTSSTEATWTLKANQQHREHVERSAANTDVDFKTLRQGSPHSLIARKNQRTYERRAAQRAADLDHLAQLQGTGSVVDPENM